MSLIDQWVEESLDRVLEKKLGDFISRGLDGIISDKLEELLVKTIQKNIEVSIQKKIDNAFKEVIIESDNVTSIIVRLKEKLKKANTELDQKLTEKLIKVTNDINLEFEIPKELRDHIHKRMSEKVVSLLSPSASCSQQINTILKTKLMKLAEGIKIQMPA